MINSFFNISKQFLGIRNSSELRRASRLSSDQSSLDSKLWAFDFFQVLFLGVSVWMQHYDKRVMFVDPNFIIPRLGGLGGLPRIN